MLNSGTIAQTTGRNTSPWRVSLDFETAIFCVFWYSNLGTIRTKRSIIACRFESAPFISFKQCTWSDASLSAFSVPFLFWASFAYTSQLHGLDLDPYHFRKVSFVCFFLWWSVTGTLFKVCSFRNAAVETAPVATVTELIEISQPFRDFALNWQ